MLPSDLLLKRLPGRGQAHLNTYGLVPIIFSIQLNEEKCKSKTNLTIMWLFACFACA
jgi:hypothetical protein